MVPAMPLIDLDVCAGMFCPWCGGHGDVLPRSPDILLRRCCGILLSWQWESEEAYEALYTQDSLYHEAEQQREQQRTYWERDGEAVAAAHSRCKALFGLFPFDKNYFRPFLVDIGTATGAFPFIAQAYGYDAHGIEPNEAMVRDARMTGRAIRHGGWEMVKANGYDVITLHDVFEHLTRPLRCLQRLHTLLKDDGVLVIEMPELDCPQCRKEGLAWKHLRPRQHVALYSDLAAQRLFTACGFRVTALVRPMQGKLAKICYYLQKAE